MTKEACLAQIIQCTNAISSAVAADKAKIDNPRKRSDGHAHWSAAAYNFGRLLRNDSISGEELRDLYYKGILSV